MVVLGNIFRNRVLDPEDAEFEYGILLNPAGWNFSDGVTKPYSGRGTGHGTMQGNFEFSKQVLAFAANGSFFFKGNMPESVKLLNWNEIQQSLIIKLTQVFYSFRDLYVVTECATVDDWTLAISGSDKRGARNWNRFRRTLAWWIFSGFIRLKPSSQKTLSFTSVKKSVSWFFKAKKLVVQDEKLDVFISELISQISLGQQRMGRFLLRLWISLRYVLSPVWQATCAGLPVGYAAGQ